MARTISEKIEAIEIGIQKSSTLIEAAIPKKDYAQIQRSGNILVEYQIKLGLLYWRQRKNPSAQFKAAANSVKVVSSHLKAIDPELPRTVLLKLGVAIYVAFLTKLPFTALDLNQQDEHVLARAFFGNVLIGAANIADWPKYRDALPQGERYDLARRTDALYADLLAGRITPEVGVRLGEKLWEEREDHDYFQSGVSGGGDDNHQLVDYQRGAILKKIGSTVPTIHAWVW